MRRYPVLLLALAALWGASYLFIKLAVDELAPATAMLGRLVLSAPLLFALLAARSGAGRALRDVLDAWRPGLVLGAINAAIPFTLVAWGETHVDSGVAAIANATVPLFVVLLAIRFRPSERARGLRLAGIAVGLAGAGFLAGVQPDGGWWAVAGTLAVVLASISYAAGGLYAQHSVAARGGLVLATSSMCFGALLMLPLGLAQLPGAAPSWRAVGGVVGLAVIGTFLAQIVFFEIIRLYGPARTTLVTYLLPATALVYGAVFLGEPFSASKLGGLALVLAGVALGSGLLRLPRRTEVAAATR